MHKLILHHTWTFLSTKVGLIKVCECARKNICKCFTGIVKKNYTLITKPNGIGTPTIFLQNVKKLGISHIFNRRWFRNWPQRISGVSFGQQWASPVFPFPKKNRKINHNFHWIRQFYQINIYSSFKPISFIYTTYIIYCVLLFSDFFFSCKNFKWLQFITNQGCIYTGSNNLSLSPLPFSSGILAVTPMRNNMITASYYCCYVIT